MLQDGLFYIPCVTGERMGLGILLPYARKSSQLYSKARELIVQTIANSWRISGDIADVRSHDLVYVRMKTINLSNSTASTTAVHALLSLTASFQGFVCGFKCHTIICNNNI